MKIGLSGNKMEYKEIPGFYNLLDFDLPQKILKKLWGIQEYLNHVEKNKKYFKKYNPILWKKAQGMSAEYQLILFSYPRTVKK